MFSENLKNYDNHQSSVYFHSYIYKVSLVIILLLICIFPTHAAENNLILKLSNALSGQAVPNSEILVYQQQANQSWKWIKKHTTNSQGALSLDLPGLGQGTQYKFRAKPYTTGAVYSRPVSNAGSLDFKVGHLQAQIIDGTTGKYLPNHKIFVRELLADGKTKWVASGLSEANGLIRFDIPEMGSGKKFVLAARSSSDGQFKRSKTITRNDSVTFTVGNKLLTVNLINALSGQALPNSEILVYQQQADQSWKWIKKYTTNAQGVISLDLPGLGQGTQYRFRAKPYTTGVVYSQPISKTGSFDFKVGHLEAQIIDGKTGKALPNHKILVRELLADGKTKWVASGLSEASGRIRFDIAEMGSGKKFVLATTNPFDGKTKYSDVITQNAKITFTVGNKLLTVHLTNAISGHNLPNHEIKVFQQSIDGLLVFTQKNFTNNQGQINFDLDKLGKGSSYVLLTKAYGTIVKSKPISKVGLFDFNIGKVQVKLTNKDSQQPFIGQQLILFEKSSNGKLIGQATLKTDSNGIGHFDPTALGTGKVYVARAYDLFGNKKLFYSPWITTSGVIDFTVSPTDFNSADLNPPEITFISPSENALVSSAGFEVKTLVNDNEEINTVAYKVIDDTKGMTTGNMKLVRGQWKFLVTSSMLTAKQTIKVVISAIDNAQNVTEITRQFRVIKDLEAPTINIKSHQDFDQISENGFLLSGSVSDNTEVKEITASVMDPLLGLVVDNKPLEISEDNGRWGLPVRKVSRNNDVTVSLNAKDYAGNITTKQLTLNVMTNGLNGRQLINRLTFGATDDLLEDIKKSSGAETFLLEQLHPELIDDSDFELMLAEMGEPDSPATLQNHQLAHAIYSKRQLQEVMTWFWDNHFSTDLSKTKLRRELADNKSYRKHALGNFRELLQISATSPAMLIYLDNRLNHKNEPNENYARELLELHTLGINGGYTQNDVAEVARVFTGWQINDQGFNFRNSYHDYEEKVVLETTIPSGLGLEGGIMVLDILATHPSTAQFICTKFLQQFISDSPNVNSINNCVKDFLENAEKDDQIARTLEGIFRSKEFGASQHSQSKVKNPMEFVAGFARQFPINLSYFDSRNALRSMNMNLFYYPLPTGWPEIGEQWINSDRYLQYFQFISNAMTKSSSIHKNYLEDSLIMFANKGHETPEAIVGYLFDLVLSNNYSVLEWNTAVNILTENSKIYFDINDVRADERMKKLLSTVLNFPAYQLQ